MNQRKKGVKTHPKAAAKSVTGMERKSPGPDSSPASPHQPRRFFFMTQNVWLSVLNLPAG